MSTATELRILVGDEWRRRGYAPIAATGSTPVGAGTSTDIQTAITAAGAGGTVLLAANTIYRFTGPVVPLTNQTIAGQTGTILRGSVVLTGWTASGGRWYKDTPLPTYTESSAAQCEINAGSEGNPCHKREQVFRDGVHLNRKMVLANVGPGDFYQDFTADRVWVGDDPTGALMEMSSTTYAMRPTVSGFRLTGVAVEHFASEAQRAAVEIGGTGSTMDNCVFQWNHAIGGRVVNATNAYVHHCKFLHNGQMGAGHHNSTGTVFEDNEMGWNNTDGFWGADWESGGIKVSSSTDITLQRNFSHDNIGIGIWVDINNYDIRVLSNDILDNFTCGIRYEISYKGEIAYNVVDGNGMEFAYGTRLNPSTGVVEEYRNSDWSLFATDGINVFAASDVEVHDNVVGSRKQNANGIGNQMRPRGTGNRGVWDLVNVYVHHNKVYLTTGTITGQGVAGFGTLGVTDPNVYATQKNIRWDFNEYFVDSTSKRRHAWPTANGGAYKTLTEMKALGQELNSTESLAPRDGARVTNAMDDGNWRSVSTTAFSGTVTVNRLGHYSTTDYGYSSWIRVQVNIPQGATIDSAYLEVLAKGINGTTPPLVIRMDAAINSAPITTRAELELRARSATDVAWPLTTTEWVVNSWIPTPSVVAMLQEKVSDPSWVSGNYITWFLEPEELSYTTQQQINFVAYDDPSQAASGLVFDYS